MEISAGMKLDTVLENGTAEQKAVARYFDKDNNGIIDEKEASIFNSSQVNLSSGKVKITSSNGEVEEYEDMAKAKSEEYYQSGSIPVAVVDIFSGPDNQGGAAAHGNCVANIIKKDNPEASVDRFDTSPTRTLTKEQKEWDERCKQNPRLEEETAKTPEGLAFLYKLFPVDTSYKPYEVALDEVKQKMDAGKEYKAVNISSAAECSYDDLNQICEKELGCKITPENVSQYRNQIKEILSKKIKSGDVQTLKDARTGRPADAKLVLSIMEKIEGLKIPVYIAQGYKAKEHTEQTVNIWSLPENARAVEGGTTFGGEIQSPISSTNSLAVDSTTGKRRIEDSLTFWLGKFHRNSTSFATPKVTAKNLDVES